MTFSNNTLQRRIFKSPELDNLVHKGVAVVNTRYYAILQVTDVAITDYSKYYSIDALVQLLYSDAARRYAEEYQLYNNEDEGN